MIEKIEEDSAKCAFAMRSKEVKSSCEILLLKIIKLNHLFIIIIIIIISIISLKTLKRKTATMLSNDRINRRIANNEETFFSINKIMLRHTKQKIDWTHLILFHCKTFLSQCLSQWAFCCLLSFDINPFIPR